MKIEGSNSERIMSNSTMKGANKIGLEIQGNEEMNVTQTSMINFMVGAPEGRPY